jgi:hypothetical protein
MATPRLEEFGQLLVAKVRDKAVRACDSLLDPGARDPAAVRWRKALQEGSEQALREAIPDCIDEALSNLLQAIDDGALRLQFVTNDGTIVDLTDEGEGGGELAGWFLMTGGWRAKYSKERVVDDFAV